MQLDQCVPPPSSGCIHPSLRWHLLRALPRVWTRGQSRGQVPAQAQETGQSVHLHPRLRPNAALPIFLQIHHNPQLRLRGKASPNHWVGLCRWDDTQHWETNLEPQISTARLGVCSSQCGDSPVRCIRTKVQIWTCLHNTVWVQASFLPNKMDYFWECCFVSVIFSIKCSHRHQFGQLHWLGLQKRDSIHLRLRVEGHGTLWLPPSRVPHRPDVHRDNEGGEGHRLRSPEEVQARPEQISIYMTSAELLPHGYLFHLRLLSILNRRHQDKNQESGGNGVFFHVPWALVQL